MNMLISSLLGALIMAQEQSGAKDIFLTEPVLATHVVKTVEARCGPHYFQIVFVGRARNNNDSILSLTVNDIELSPQETLLIYRALNSRTIEQANFGGCILKDGKIVGVRLRFDVSSVETAEPVKWVSFDIIDGKIYPEKSPRG